MPVKDLLVDTFISSLDWTAGSAAQLRIDAGPPSAIRADTQITDHLRYSFLDLPPQAARVSNVAGYWRAGFDVNTGGTMNGSFSIYRVAVGPGTNVLVLGTSAHPETTTATSGSLGAPGGVPWTPEIVNDLAFSINADRPNGGPIFGVCFAKLIVTYAVDDDDAHFNVAGLGPLVAVGLHEMAKLAATLFARTGVRLRPSEFEQTWRSMRNARRPVFV